MVWKIENLMVKLPQNIKIRKPNTMKGVKKKISVLRYTCINMLISNNSECSKNLLVYYVGLHCHGYLCSKGHNYWYLGKVYIKCLEHFQK